MIGRTKEGWSVIADDHSEWSHSDLIRLHKRIDIDLAGMRSQDFIRPYLLAGSAVIDIGAHLGAFTIPMMRAVGPEGLVLAIEPDRELFTCLERNINKEQNDNKESASAFRCPWAIAERTGIRRFWRNFYNRGGGHLDFSGRAGASTEASEDVRAVTLDELFPLLEGKSVSFIKADCEGSEIDVIRGGENLLSRYRPVLFIEISAYAFSDRGITQEVLEEELAAFGYRFEYFPKEWVDAGKPPHDLLALPHEI